MTATAAVPATLSSLLTFERPLEPAKAFLFSAALSRVGMDTKSTADTDVC